MRARGGREEVRAIELARSLRRVQVDGPSSLDILLPEVRSLLDTDHVVCQRYTPVGRFLSLDFAFVAGSLATQRFIDAFRDFLATTPDAYGPFRSDVSPAVRRNKVERTYAVMPEAIREIPLTRVFLRSMGIDRHDQMRVMLGSDDGEWLGYFGAFQTGLYTERQERLLSALLPAMRERLTLERQLGEAPLRAAAFDATFEALGRPAFVVRQGGGGLQLLFANSSGQALLDHARGEGWQELARCIEAPGPDASYQVTELLERGLPGTMLLVRRSTAVPIDRLALAQRTWLLTPRQMQVLELLVRGRSNKAVGERLGCSEGTVELHVTALLQKSRSESRAALVARFWSEL